MKSSPQVAADLLLRPPRGFKLNKWKDTLLEHIAPSDMAVIVKLVYSGFITHKEAGEILVNRINKVQNAD